MKTRPTNTKDTTTPCNQCARDLCWLHGAWDLPECPNAIPIEIKEEVWQALFGENLSGCLVAVTLPGGEKHSGRLEMRVCDFASFLDPRTGQQWLLDESDQISCVIRVKDGFVPEALWISELNECVGHLIHMVYEVSGTESRRTAVLERIVIGIDLCVEGEPCCYSFNVARIQDGRVILENLNDGMKIEILSRSPQLPSVSDQGDVNE